MQCIVYLPHSYTGKGPAESCVQIIKEFENCGLKTTLFVGREKKSLPSNILVRRGLPKLLNWLPWSLATSIASFRLRRAFEAYLNKQDPGIAYFWPNMPHDLVEHAKRKGWIAVREMTNRTLHAAKASLDAGFAAAGEQRDHHISEALVKQEKALLPEFDFIFSSNEHVDESLIALDIPEERILRTSFGWAEERFGEAALEPRTQDEFVVGYLGTISIGKGVMDLLAAWREWEAPGRLLLAGPIEWSMTERIREALEGDKRIEHLGYVEDVERFYSSCDVVVIPTLDEGGPQVTYEAAAAGATIIGTPMARARLLEHDRNALIVPTHGPEAIRDCFKRLVAEPEVGQRLARQAQEDVRAFSYKKVGAERAKLLIEKCRKSKETPAFKGSDDSDV